MAPAPQTLDLRDAAACETAAREALRACFLTLAGRSPVDIVTLGLIAGLTATPDPNAPGAGIPGVPERFRLQCTLLAPPGGPDAGAMLQAQAHNLLAGMPQWSQIEVMLLDEPAWREDRLTPEARRALGLDPPLFPILGTRC